MSMESYAASPPGEFDCRPLSAHASNRLVYTAENERQTGRLLAAQLAESPKANGREDEKQKP
ncbi:uncharacterized protein FIBRA_08602 [Fibroporia radiculosa]|uniref:Uncharacterized protein n=1 Tax=Fibroporia radiculosa TaxID=599839 RepID=J4I313_9APHY|nr:uncharacterized protein FIBRA_08602 [Fibroporia radiculosa]CCM06347.1 predicted protein [Fibroporia radiculosa]